MDSDVLIIGGGPAGSTAAQRLAAAGLQVAVIEEHAVIGEPVDCTGVVGTELFQHLPLSREIVVGSVEAVTIHSPGGIGATYRAPAPLAYTVDRARLDQALGARAQEAGAVFLLNTQALDVVRGDGGVTVICRGPGGEPRRLSAPLVILAGGPRFVFQERLGLGTCEVLWRSAHAELPGNGLPHAQVFLGRDIAPGAFGWAVPIQRDGRPYVRVGVNSHADASQYLRQLCETRFSHLLPPGAPLRSRSWVVPIVPLSSTYGDRVMAVGDAAGQVKPTSGGGIYYGILSAELAADTAVEAFRRGRFDRETLAPYERRWRGTLGLDLKVGTLFRRLFCRMTDGDVDDLFRALHTDDLLSRIAGKIRFDWHHELIVFFLKHPRIARILLRRCWDRQAEPGFSDLPPI